MKTSACIAFFLLSLFSPRLSFAQEKFQADERITVDSALRHDLYLAAEYVGVNAPVYGDLRAAAADIKVQDTIRGDLTVAGGTVNVSGPVLDDLVAFGGDINIMSTVAGDLIVMGGTVNIGREVTVDQDLVVFSGEVTMEGKIGGDVKAWGGEILMLGETAGAVAASGGEITIGGTFRGPIQLTAESISLEPDANMYGDLRYWLPEGQPVPDFDRAMVNASALYDASLSREEIATWLGIPIPWFTIAIIYFLSALLMIAFFHWVFDKPLVRASQKLREDFMGSFGYGVLYLLGMPMLIGLLLFTLVGIPLGLLLLFGYSFSILFGHMIAATVFTSTINEQYKYHWSKGRKILVALLVFAVIRGLTLTPVLGLFLSVLVVGACFGALIMTAVRKKSAVPA